MITFVVAVDEQGVIGREGGVPWRLRDDLRQLKALTTSQIAIVGRKTYESMERYYDRSGRAMPAKTYIVVTRDAAYRPARPEAQAAPSPGQAVALAQALGGAEGDIFVLGGASIYRELLPRAGRIYLTRVHARIRGGDTYFPPLNPSEWRETARAHHPKDENNEYDFDILTLDRR